MKNIANWCERSFRSHAAQISIHALNAASVAGRTCGGGAAITGAITAARAVKKRVKCKPVAFIAAVFLFLGMGFGENALALCDSELAEKLNADKVLNGIDRRYKYRPNEDTEDHKKYEKNCFRDHPGNVYSIRDHSVIASWKRDLINIQSRAAQGKHETSGLDIALKRLEICRAEVAIGACSGGATSSPSSLQASPQQPASATYSGPSDPRSYQDCTAYVLESVKQRRPDSASEKECLRRAGVWERKANQAAAATNTPASPQPQAPSNPLQSETDKSQQRARDVQAQADAEAEVQRKRSEQTQARADAEAQRRGKRMHDPAAQAHECLSADFKPIVGGFKNTCGYAISYGYCVENPKKGVLTDHALFNCARMKQGFSGGGLINANSYDANHTRGGTGVQFFACRQPAYATDLTYVRGKGLEGRCVYL